MIRIAALTSGRNTPSSRFRVRQHVEPLREQGINIREFVPTVEKYRSISLIDNSLWSRGAAKAAYAGLAAMKLAARLPGVAGSWNADVTWLERDLFAGRVTLEPLLRKPIALDVDDAVWLLGPTAFAAARDIGRRAAVVIAGNAFIAEWFSSSSNNVHVVATGVDTERFSPDGARRESDRPFTVGWTGLSYNFRFLYEIEPALRRFLTQHRSELRIIAERPPQFRDIPAEAVRFVKWTPDSEAESLKDLDVGIMPLPFNDWSRGKCSLKMLLYMATGIPVVVSPVGLNNEILEMSAVGFGARSNDDWYGALEELYRDANLRMRLGSEGRRVVEQRFSRTVVTEQLARIFRSIV